MLQPRIDRNVEVVTCLLNLTERGSLDWNTGISSQPYRREVMQHFSLLKKHPAVLLTNQLHAQGFWWDAMIELAVTCTVFPEAALTADLRNSRYVNAGEGDPAKGKKTLDELLDLIDDFSTSKPNSTTSTAHTSPSTTALFAKSKRAYPTRPGCN